MTTDAEIDARRDRAVNRVTTADHSAAERTARYVVDLGYSPDAGDCLTLALAYLALREKQEG